MVFIIFWSGITYSASVKVRFMKFHVNYRIKGRSESKKIFMLKTAFF